MESHPKQTEAPQREDILLQGLQGGEGFNWKVEAQFPLMWFKLAMNEGGEQVWTRATKDWERCGMLPKHLFGSFHR